MRRRTGMAGEGEIVRKLSIYFAYDPISSALVRYTRIPVGGNPLSHTPGSSRQSATGNEYNVAKFTGNPEDSVYIYICVYTCAYIYIYVYSVCVCKRITLYNGSPVESVFQYAYSILHVPAPISLHVYAYNSR